MDIARIRLAHRIAGTAMLGLVLGFAGPVEGASAADAKPEAPVLLLHESVDVDGDGVEDSVSYFSSREDGALDAQSIDFGSTGKISVLALRCDFDKDGKEDDWMVVDPDTEELKAVLLDKDDDGEADLVDLGHGQTRPFHGHAPHLPAARAD